MPRHSATATAGATFSALALVMAGCGVAERHASAPKGSGQRLQINERRGSVGRVSLRQPQSEATKTLGGPGLDAPHSLPLPDFLPQTSQDATARGAGLSVTFAHGKVASIIVWRAGATTSHGIAVGDQLAKVRLRYAAAIRRCDPGKPREDGVRPAQCRLKIGPGDYLFFGGNPIQTVVLSTQPFG